MVAPVCDPHMQMAAAGKIVVEGDENLLDRLETPTGVPGNSGDELKLGGITNDDLEGARAPLRAARLSAGVMSIGDFGSVAHTMEEGVW